MQRLRPDETHALLPGFGISQRVTTQMSPMTGARTTQYAVIGVLAKLAYATPKSARISTRR